MAMLAEAVGTEKVGKVIGQIRNETITLYLRSHPERQQALNSMVRESRVHEYDRSVVILVSYYSSNGLIHSSDRVVRVPLFSIVTLQTLNFVLAIWSPRVLSLLLVTMGRRKGSCLPDWHFSCTCRSKTLVLPRLWHLPCSGRGFPLSGPPSHDGLRN